METRLALPITHVTIHPGQARVERSGPLPADLPAGIVVISDLPLILLESSIQVRIDGAPLEVAELTLLWDLELPPEAQLPALEAKLQSAERRLSALQARARELEQRIGWWNSLAPDVLDTTKLPSSGPEATDFPSNPETWGKVLELIDVRTGAAQAAERGLRQSLEEASREVDLARDALARASTAGIAGTPRRKVQLRLVRRSDAAPDPGQAVVVLSYLVPGATWVPSYEVRVSPDGGEAELAIRALVAQRTGEDWSGVRLSLSTADASYTTELPVLAALRIGRAQAAVAKSGWRPPPEGLQALFAGYDRDRPPGAEPAYQPPKLAVPASILPGGGQDTIEATRLLDELEGGSAAPTATSPAPRDKARARKAKTAQEPAIRAGMPSPEAPPPSFGAMYQGAPGMPPQEALSAQAPSLEDFSELPESFDMDGMPPAPAAKRAALAAPQSRSMGLFRGGGGGMPPAPPGAPPMVAGALAAAAVVARPTPPPGLEPGQSWLNYDNLRLGGASDPKRGELYPLSLLDSVREVEPDIRRVARIIHALQDESRDAGAIGGLELPRYCCPVAQSRGRFDHRYDAGFAADIPSDGRYHAITLSRARGAARIVYRTVPRLEPAVYRELVLANPLQAPLLAGPADLYIGSDLVATSSLETVAEGGAIRLGLGLEERIKVARNTRFKEVATGLISGSLSLEHEIVISLTSLLDRAAELEVLERIPVTDDPEVEVKETASEPRSVAYDQVDRGRPARGGRRFMLTLPAGGEATCRLCYKVTISSKLELINGNRRD